jgi:hypothetical protein
VLCNEVYVANVGRVVTDSASHYLRFRTGKNLSTITMKHEHTNTYVRCICAN